MTTLNLGNLATFRLVVQRGSFSAAANVLGLSQPAVSLQIRQLEQFLQARLIERTGRGVKATAAGVALLAHGERIGQAVDEAIRSVSAFSHEVSGTVTLGTGATACIHLLPPLLQRLRLDYPLLRLDLGLVTLPASGRTLDITPFLNEELVFIEALAQPHPAGSLTPEVLHALPLIAFENGSSTRTLIDGWFATAGLPTIPVMQLGSIEAIKRMVSAGLGYSIVPHMSVAHPNDRKALNVRSLNPLLQRQLAIVIRQDKILSRGIGAIIQMLQKKSELI